MARLATTMSKSSTDGCSICGEKSSTSTADRQASGTKGGKGLEGLKKATAKLRNQLRKVIDKVSSDKNSIPVPEDRLFRGGFKNCPLADRTRAVDPDAYIEAIRIQQNFARKYGYEECPILEEALQDALRRKELGQQNECARPNSAVNAADKLARADGQLAAGKHEFQDHVSRAHVLDRSWEVLSEDEDDDTPLTLDGTPFGAPSASRLAASVQAESGTSLGSSSSLSSLGSITENAPQAWLDAASSVSKSAGSRARSVAQVATQHEAEWKTKTTLSRQTSASSQPANAFDSAVDISSEQYVPARAPWPSSTPGLSNWNSLPS